MTKEQKNFFLLLKNNKEIVDKYLEIEYNIACERLVISDDPVERGKAQYLRQLIRMLETK